MVRQSHRSSPHINGTNKFQDKLPVRWDNGGKKYSVMFERVSFPGSHFGKTNDNLVFQPMMRQGRYVNANSKQIYNYKPPVPNYMYMNEKKRKGKLNQTKYRAPFNHFHYYRTGSGGMSLHAKGKLVSSIHPRSNMELRLRQGEKFTSDPGSYAFIKAATTSINKQREMNKQKHNALVDAQKKEKLRQIKEQQSEMKRLQNKLDSDRRKYKLSLNKWKEAERRKISPIKKWVRTKFGEFGHKRISSVRRRIASQQMKERMKEQQSKNKEQQNRNKNALIQANKINNGTISDIVISLKKMTGDSKDDTIKVITKRIRRTVKKLSEDEIKKILFLLRYKRTLLDEKDITKINGALTYWFKLKKKEEHGYNNSNITGIKHFDIFV